MARGKGRKPGEPGYGDYVKAAFNYRMPVRGLGGLPINWLFLGAVGVASIVAWPVLLVGAGAEVGFLTALANSDRFQRSVRARKLQSHDEAVQDQLEVVAGGLSPGAQARYAAFGQKCSEIVEIARKLQPADGSELQTYADHLAELRSVYVRMITLLEVFSRYSVDWNKTDPEPAMRAVEKELERADLSDSMRRSKEATLEILKRRAESRKAISERAHVLHSEIGRLEQEVALLRDQALLTRDPSILTQSMDSAAGILEQHNTWLQENAAVFEGLQQEEAG